MWVGGVDGCWRGGCCGRGWADMQLRASPMVVSQAVTRARAQDGELDVGVSVGGEWEGVGVGVGGRALL